MTRIEPKLSRKGFRKIVEAALAVRREPALRTKPRRVLARLALARSIPLAARIVLHFRLVCVHKFWVLWYCCRAGVPLRGLLHDWSKFSPVEFIESVRYFHKKGSPVGLCREIEGCSLAWLHHKGRNKHHFEYWSDTVDVAGVPAPRYGQFYPIPMPFPYALEFICDSLAASRAYHGGRLIFEEVEGWWRERQRKPLNMHPETKRFADEMYRAICEERNCGALKRAKEIFERAREEVRGIDLNDEF